MEKIVEGVPNFSEGRDRAVIDRIAGSMESAGARLLLIEPDADYNRVVIAFVGEPDTACRAAVAGIREAHALIDMRGHSGGHPRIGAADVVPFVPVRGVTMDDCVAIAREVGKAVGRDPGVPVYLYGHAAARPDRRDLSRVRKGQYEALPDRIATEEGRPDFGPAEFVPRFGAVCVGARPFLIAYNVNLAGGDLAMASEIAGRLRESGRRVDGERVPGLLREAKAIGVELKNKGICQVSMNLTDYRTTPMHAAYETVDRLAGELGARAAGSEIVAIVPAEALTEAGEHFARKTGKNPAGMTESALLDLAVRGLGLDSLAPFVPGEKVLEHMI